MNLEVLYAILVAVARNRAQIIYGELSRAYFETTQEWHEPHGSWDQALGELNQMLHAVGWPPIFAVVVLQGVGEPGGGFWGSSLSVSTRPAEPAPTLPRGLRRDRLAVQFGSRRRG
jgi:hypothetical protein